MLTQKKESGFKKYLKNASKLLRKYNNNNNNQSRFFKLLK